MEKIRLIPPMWIYDVNLFENHNTYKIDFEIIKDTPTTYSVGMSVLCIYPEHVEIIDGMPSELICPPAYKDDVLVDFEKLDFFDEDLREGIKKINCLNLTQNKEYHTTTIAGLQCAIKYTRELFEEHNQKFMAKMNDVVRNKIHQDLKNRDKFDIIRLWNKRFEPADDYVPNMIYENTSSAYHDLCNYDDYGRINGVQVHSRSEYDLYLIREESINQIPYVTSFSNIREINLDYKLREYIYNHPFVYPDIVANAFCELEPKIKSCSETYKQTLQDATNIMIDTLNDYTNKENTELVKNTLKENDINL